MKFLHTSDLHIGKKLEGKVLRLDEQREALWEIVEIAKKEQVDIILIAGDVFDTFLPSSEAENLFFEFVNHISENSLTAVCISGNHDDAERLTAAKSLASKRNVYLCGGNNDFSLGGKTDIKLQRVGKNYLVFSKDKESVFIATLPYFGEAPVGEVVDKEKEYGERVIDVISGIFENMQGESASILLTHLFMVGGEKTEAERNIDLGGIKVVSPAKLPEVCNYTALGHLHKRQVVSKSKNAIYCGSPLQYAFDEVGLEKSVTVFKIENNQVSDIREVPLSSGIKLANVRCEGVELVDEKLSNFKDNYVNLTIVTDRALTVDETAKIKNGYPKVVNLKLEFLKQSEHYNSTRRRSLNDEQLFDEFYKRKHGSMPDEEIKKAYLEIMSEE